MLKVSNPKIFKLISKLLILLVMAKSIALAVLWLMPSEGVNVQLENNYKPSYQRVDFKNMLSSHVETPVIQSSAVSSGIDIKNMILNGLYGKGIYGFAIVALKSSPSRASIVAVGETFSGYVLKNILSQSVVFRKDGKEYVLWMNVKDMKGKKTSFIRKAYSSEKEQKVSRSDIRSYAANPTSIWKDISIIQLKNKKGFKITSIRKGSKMSALGLQKGDIMIRANNNNLVSYKDAIELYKNIDALQVLQLVVLRNNQEKEFVYEIH